MKTILTSTLIGTLLIEAPDLKPQVESSDKWFLQTKEEPKSPDDLQVHLPETPCEERPVCQTVACNSGVPSFSQTKNDEYKLAYSPDGLSVCVKTLAKSPSQIFSPAPPFLGLISAA